MDTINDFLEPGETVIKMNRGRSDYVWKGIDVGGLLWLTSKRLLWTSSEAYSGKKIVVPATHPDGCPITLIIPLRNIRKVETNSMRVLWVITDKNEKYRFSDAEPDFVNAIEQAREIMR